MPIYLKPHSPEWFRALEDFDPSKAAMTWSVIKKFGFEVCSICGDVPAHDYQLIDGFMERNAVATIKLCDDCLQIKERIHKEKFILFTTK